MKEVYRPAEPVEAEILRAYLEAHGIAATIFGANLWSARGELPADPSTRLIVNDERDAERAITLLREYERRRHAHGQWRCVCGEESPITFETCWACGHERPAPLA